MQKKSSGRLFSARGACSAHMALVQRIRCMSCSYIVWNDSLDSCRRSPARIPHLRLPTDPVVVPAAIIVSWAKWFTWKSDWATWSVLIVTWYGFRQILRSALLLKLPSYDHSDSTRDLSAIPGSLNMEHNNSKRLRFHFTHVPD